MDSEDRTEGDATRVPTELDDLRQRVAELETELSTTQERLRQVMDTLFGYIGLYTVEGLIIETNRTPLEAAGLELDDVVGKPLWDTYWWNYEPAVQKRLRAAIARAAAGETVRHEERGRIMDSVLIDIELTFEPLRARDGAIIGLVGFGSDITQHTQASRALRENDHRRRLQLAVEAAGLGTFSLDLRAMSVSYDAQSARMLGFRPHELPGRDSFFDGLHTDDRARTKMALDAYLSGMQAKYDVNFRSRTKSGHWKWIQARGSIVERDASGRPRQMLGTYTDIDERQRAAEALHASQERFRLSFETAPFGVLMLALDSRFLHCNEAFIQIVGYSAEELRAKRLKDISHPECAHIGEVEFKEMFEGRRKTVQVDKRCVTKEGRTIWVSISGAMIWDSSGSPLYGVAHVLDISQRIHTETELREHAMVQETLAQEVNHRVGNILSSILAMSQLKRGELDGNRQSPSGAWHRLERRIRGLATVHTMLSQSMWRPIRTRELCQRIVSTVCHGFGRKADIAIQGSNVEVASDQAQYLALALGELALNSIEHASSDSFAISISVSRKDRDVVVVYRDNGPGYSEDALVGYRSAGLGLKLVDRIVSRSLKGHVALENNGGAAATLRFPCLTPAD